MNEIGQFVVLLAAVLYLAERAGNYITKAFVKAAERQMHRFADMHEHSARQIEGTFEMWWELGAKKKAQAGLVKKFAEAHKMEIPDDLNDNDIVPLVEPFLEDLEGHARHLAIHAHLSGKDGQFLRKITSFGGLRQAITAEHEEHHQFLQQERGMMLDNGIDPEEIDRHFREDNLLKD